jgi:hypothetical protein
MKSVYGDICAKCSDYIYDVEGRYQKLFQRIYNASTSLYYKVAFSEDDRLYDIETVYNVLVKINEILSDVVFPNEKEENIKKLLDAKGFNIGELLVETPSLIVTEYQE